MGQIVYPPPKVLNPWALKTLIMIVIEDRTFKEVVSFEMKPNPIWLMFSWDKLWIHKDTKDILTQELHCEDTGKNWPPARQREEGLRWSRSYWHADFEPQFQNHKKTIL